MVHTMLRRRVAGTPPGILLLIPDAVVEARGRFAKCAPNPNGREGTVNVSQMPKFVVALMVAVQ